MEDKIDIRIIKTKRAIKSVFFELMKEIGFQNITVKKIIERAEINRSTFYAHYIDKFDLLQQVENELLIEYKNIVDHAPVEAIISQSNISDAIPIYFNQLAIYIHENGTAFALLQSDKGDPAFTIKLSEMVKSIWNEKGLFNRLSIPQTYAFAALISMMTSLIAEWVKSDFRESPKEFVQIVFKIVKDIPKNIFE